jgi:hypothetical protein
MKGRHSDTTEVMEAELQAMLDTLTRERCIRVEEDYFEGDGGQWAQY